MKKINFLPLVFLVFFCFSHTVAASTIIQQTDNSTLASTCASYNPNTFEQSFGKGLTGTYKSLTFQIDVIGASSANLNIAIYGNTNANMYSGSFDTSGAGGADAPVSVISGIQNVTFSWAAGHTFNPAMYYWAFVYVASGSATSIAPEGSATDLFLPISGAAYTAQGDCNNSSFGAPQGAVTSTATGYDTYFEFDTNTVPTPPPNNLTIASPTEGSVSGSTTVTFAGTYYSNSGVTFSAGGLTGIKLIINQSSGVVGVLAPIEIDIPETTQDATTSWVTTKVLTTGTNYNVQGYLVYGSTDLYPSAPAYVDFSVVSNPIATIPTCDGSAVTCAFQDLLVYLFVPSQGAIGQYTGLYGMVIKKPPFGYVVEINSALNGLTVSGTDPFTLEELPIIQTDIFDPIRAGLVWVLWVAFAFVLFHRLKNIDL